MDTIKFLFGMQNRVSRKPYLLWGLALIIFKFAGEAAFYFVATNKFLDFFGFLSPLLTNRYPDFATLPDWLGPLVILWSLPFIWVGVGMSIRRAVDANLSPWAGILFLFPGLNYVLILCLCIIPTSKADQWQIQARNQDAKKLRSPLLITIALALCGTSLIWFNTNFINTYGASLFVGIPLTLGLVLGYFLNSNNTKGFKTTAGYITLAILLTHLLLLLFALEGFICLAMSFPLSLALALIGSVFGAAIAKYGKQNSVSPCLLLLVLPLLPIAEKKLSNPHPDFVLSSIVINASPNQVWRNVVKFPDLPKPEEWLFRIGVAHPIRARIEGQGVGAIRRCEFSTGDFVEPITVWDEPNHLAFDVKYQPQPMQELSPYDHVDAPHLDGYFRSMKGEFRLTSLPEGKTLLEGRTWYEMDIHPGWYWQIYGRWFIHIIHMRVLNHIKNISENQEISNGV